MAEQVANVDQVDAGLDQVHRPAAPQGVGRDRQSGCPAGVVGPDGSHVAGEDLGDAGSGQSGVVGSVEQWVGVGAEPGVRLEVFQIVGDEPGGRAHQGHVSDPGALPVDRHGNWVGGADVGDVEVADFLGAGGGVVGQGEQDGVADGACTGGAGLGEQYLDLVAGQVSQIRGGGVLLPDRQDLGELVEVVGLLDGGVAAERLDHREALVAGGR